jgi:glycosyltransferase involved in cell wall biosynthesis
MDLSVVIPVYNEEENVEPLIVEIEAALTPLRKSYEIVMVDDGSKDATFAKLRSIHERLGQLKVAGARRRGDSYGWRRAKRSRRYSSAFAQA